MAYTTHVLSIFYKLLTMASPWTPRVLLPVEEVMLGDKSCLRD